MAGGARPGACADLPCPASRRDLVTGRRVRVADDERSVSDVLGSILLVGITVVMAVAFGGVLLAYEGPSDGQHTQLGILVGPGADGDWGTNDAELKVSHLGGEPLAQGAVTVTYTDAAGTQSVSPTFSGGEFSIGESWTTPISATPGFSVSVSVVAEVDGGTTLLSTGSVSAGGSAATLTYVASATPTVGKGAVADFANMQSATDSNLAAVFTEGAVGGTPSVSTRAPGSASNSGASNNNVLLSDDVRSVLDNSGEWVQGAGFTAPAGFAVSGLSIGMEARAAQVTTTVAHVATVVGSRSTAGTTVSSAAVTVASGYTYLAVVTARGSSVAPDVTGISGLSGITWTDKSGPVTNGLNGVEVWVGTGTAALGAVVTATFANSVASAGISVSAYSGVATGTGSSDPVQEIQTATGNGNAVSVAAVAGVATAGRFVAAINGGGTGSVSFTSPPESGQRADFDVNGNLQHGVAGAAAAASNTFTASLTSSPTWAAVSLTLRPVQTGLPSALLSYRLSTVTGATSLTQALTSSDATYEVSIIGDRAWTLADLANIDVRVTYPTDTGSDVEVDRVYLLLTYTTTATTYTGEVTLGFSGVPNLSTHVVQVRYRVTGDTFSMYALTGGVERLCPGSLTAATYAVFSCTLSAAEYQSGSPQVRLRDATASGTTQGTLTLEYARVSSSA